MLRRIAADKLVPSRGSPEYAALQFMASDLADGLRITRPLLLKPELPQAGWDSLLDEASTMRAHAYEHGGGGQLMADVGQAATECARSRRTAAWIHENTGLTVSGEVSPTYIYYEEGSFCPVHLDRPESNDLGMLMVLEHRGPRGDETSLTYTFTPDELLWFRLTPGEALLFHSARTIHGRTPLPAGEAIVALSIGFLLAPVN
jgi:hypothetical protein